MRFKDLYDLVESEVDGPFVRFEYLRKQINLLHKGVGEINVRPIKYPKPIYDAHYILLDADRTSPYEEEFLVAEIRYCSGLDEDENARRFALTKEIMHVFDEDEEMTNSKEKFIRLLKEIQNNPLPQHASRMYDSEIGTKWMAAIILCPRKLRSKYIDKYRAGSIEDFEVAGELRLPEVIIPDIMDDYYDVVFDTLMQK